MTKGTGAERLRRTLAYKVERKIFRRIDRTYSRPDVSAKELARMLPSRTKARLLPTCRVYQRLVGIDILRHRTLDTTRSQTLRLVTILGSVS